MDTRERLMTSAADLIDENGVHEVGLDVILREAGISKTTFYKYYASKDELAAAAIEYRAHKAMEKLRTHVDQNVGATLEDDLACLFREWDAVLFKSALEGCIFVKVCSEYPNPNDAMHRAGQVFPLAMETLLHDMLVSHNVANPKLATDKLMIILQGYASYKFINKHADVRSTTEFMIRRTAQLIVEEVNWGQATKSIRALN